MSSKALVIMGTNFASNKVTTVSFGGSVPCTGITLDSDTMTFTAENQEISIGYTLAPSNTTDEVGIVSSDTSVVTIADGKAKAVGVGSATITITCGTQSATISVSSAFTMVRNFKEQYSLSVDGTHPHIVNDSAASYWGYCGAEETWGDGRYISTAHEPNIPVYKIPAGCTEIVIDVPSSSWKSQVYFFDSTQSGYSSTDYAYFISRDASAVAGDRTVSVAEGADSFGIAYRAPDIAFDKDDLTGYDVVLQ